MSSKKLDRICVSTLALTCVAGLITLCLDQGLKGPVVAAAIFSAAFAIAMHSQMRTYAFAAWVVCFVAVGILVPPLFLQMGPIRGVDLLTYLIQVAMFGMGATLTMEDFSRVFRMPKGVIAGFMLQYTVMPLLGWSIATLFRLPPEIAAGVILVGSCPGGVSSNVITYLAKGNVALSVTMTACTTLASPIVTPTMMYLLAGKSVQVDYLDMVNSICFTVLVPVIAGLICNVLMNKMKVGGTSGDRFLAAVSMIAICIICGIIAANSASDIRQVGPVLLFAVLLHNTLGYVLGYLASKAIGMNEADSRTIAIEVGLQNGGMAAMLATNVLKIPSAAIAPAIFAPVMNVSGSLLAAWWSRSASTTHQEQAQ